MGVATKFFRFMEDNLTKHKIKELRALVSEGDRVAILLQDDPDPDAMSSAIALRTLLGRNKLTTPIFSFTPVTRPENRNSPRLTGWRWSTCSRRTSTGACAAPTS